MAVRIAFSIIVWLAASAAATAQERRPEHERLTVMVGSWQTEVDVKATPTGPAFIVKGIEECAWFANLHVVCRNESKMASGPYFLDPHPQLSGVDEGIFRLHGGQPRPLDPRVRSGVRRRLDLHRRRAGDAVAVNADDDAGWLHGRQRVRVAQRSLVADLVGQGDAAKAVSVPARPHPQLTAALPRFPHGPRVAMM